MMPLPQVLAYNVAHLETAAEHWEAVADHREETYAEVNNRAHTVTWEGMSADAMHEHVGRDFNNAIHSADTLRGAANQARKAASDLYSQHTRMLYNLEDVQADGFAVAPDYTVTDIRPSNSLTEQAQRAQLALNHSADLRLKATELTEADARVGTQLQTATAGEGKVQFVDFKTDECNDPDYNDKFWRKFIGRVGSGIAVGGLGGAPTGVGVVPGMIIGGGLGGIEAFIEGATESEPPKCEK